MALFAGILRTEDLDAKLTTFTPEVIENGMATLLATYLAQRNDAQSLIVGGTVDVAKQRIKEGALDEGQELGPDGRPLETRSGGYYDIGYPLKRVGWALGWNRETFAAMAVSDLEREFNVKVAGNARRHSREIMKALLIKDNYNYEDEIVGTVAVKRLANQDGTLYGESQSQDNHYLTSGYLSSAMSVTNNPFVTMANEIREHFSTSTRIVAFINTAQRANVMSLLPNFVDNPTPGIAPALLTAQAVEPGINVPGDFLGTDGDSGVYVYVWDRIPATYIYAQAIDEVAPVRRREPQFATLRGFQQLDEERHLPFYKRTWVELFGYSVAGRLSGCAMELTADATYDNPTTL